MRRLLYAVVAAVALAPLAEIAPASAAVQHPAAAQVPCDGHQEVWIWNIDANGNLVGYWNVETTGESNGSSGEVKDSYSHRTPFCDIPVGITGPQNYREYGTSNCVTYDATRAPANTLQMYPCGAGSGLAQQWEWQTNPITFNIWNDYEGLGVYLVGPGGDNPLSMTSRNGPNPNWTWCQVGDGAAPPGGIPC